MVYACANVQMQYLSPREVRATAREEPGALRTISKLITILTFKTHMLMKVTQVIDKCASLLAYKRTLS